MFGVIKPYEWQQKKIDTLVNIFKEYEAALDMSDTGTGKTVTALGMLEDLDKQALIVCPKKVHSSWLRTAEAMGLSDNVLGVVNAEKLMYKNDWFKNGKWLVPSGAMIVADEVHRGCSGPKTKTTKIMSLTKAQKIPLLAMSATIADSPLKMRFIGFLTGLHRFNDASFYGWCRKYGCFSTPHIRGLQFPKGKTAEKHMQAIHEMLKDVSVRSRIDDIEDFPESVVQATLFDLDKASLKALTKSYEDLAEKKKETNQLTILLRARQEAELIKLPLFAELALDAISEGKSPVIFVNFRDTLFKLQELLTNLGLRIGIVVGGEDADEDIEKYERDELDAMVCMTQGGFGINLHATEGRRPRVSYISPSYDAVHMVQCLGRIHRLNGSKVVQIFVLVSGTIEERVHKAIVGKLNNIKSLNGDDLEAL
jgi:superfamily II DNA or RNA helicase